MNDQDKPNMGGQLIEPTSINHRNERLRQHCLGLAINSGNEPIAQAQKFYDFIKGAGGDPQEDPRQPPETEGKAQGVSGTMYESPSQPVCAPYDGETLSPEVGRLLGLLYHAGFQMFARHSKAHDVEYGSIKIGFNPKTDKGVGDVSISFRDAQGGYHSFKS